jgi:hypothetical protein
MDALARIAEHYDRSILHEATADGDAFWVADESGQFRYALGAPAHGADYEPAGEAWPADGQLDAPAWPADGQAEPQAWSIEAAVDESAYDTLVHPVSWAVPEDQDTFVQEGVDRRRTDEPGDTAMLARADVSQPPAAPEIPYFTGLEWTTNS